MSDEKNEKWEMPQPVFRTSTGALPRSLEETISHSFMPNAETIEIDEDDDILSIMNTIYQPPTPKPAADLDGEKTLEFDDDLILETETAPAPETEVVEDEPNPIVVTAKQPEEQASAASDNSRSSLVVFIVIALIAVAIVATLLYNSSQSSTAP